MKKKRMIIIALLLFGLFCVSCKKESNKKSEEPKTEKTEETKKNDSIISGPVWADEEKKYVYFGSFPQREIIGDELTEEIIEASYDENGFAKVDGNTYACLDGSDAFYNYYMEIGSVSEHYYDWSDSQSHYFLCEPILWRVLEKKDGQVLLLSEFALGTRPFDSSDSDEIRWNNSTLRSWLNSYGSESNAGEYDYSASDTGFFHQAFTEEEQGMIQKVTLQNKENADYLVEGSEDTEDFIFLLSAEEAERYYPTTDEDLVLRSRMAYATDYAKALGAHVDYTDEEPFAYQWLRSVGGDEDRAMRIDIYGFLDVLGTYVTYTRGTYRPALYLEETEITEPESYAPVKTKYTEPILRNGGVALASLQPSLTSSTGTSEIATQIDDWGYGCVRALKLTRGSSDDKECFVEYELSESYDRFVTLVSYSSDRLADEDLTLRILAEEKEIYCSESIYSCYEPIEIEVSLDGAKIIRFVWEGENEPGSEGAGGAILLSDAYFLPELEEAPVVEESSEEREEETEEDEDKKKPEKESNGGAIVIIAVLGCLVAAAVVLGVMAMKNSKASASKEKKQKEPREAKQPRQQGKQGKAEELRSTEAPRKQEEPTFTYLHEMNVLQYDNYYNYSDAAEDTAGTDYSGVANFFVWNPGAGKSGSVFYQTDCRYSALTMYLAPWKGFSSTAISQFVVYVNNDVRYVSPEITYGTPFFEISVDIRDAQTICLYIVSNEENGTLLLSEVKMRKA